MMERMKETVGLIQLRREKSRFRKHIQLVYEPAAQDCGTCPTAGVCCTDAHFVNVHISRLEAVAMRDALTNAPLSEAERRAVYDRAAATAGRLVLGDDGDTFSRTYSCPLFQPGTGCLVHHEAKPAPCIHHACYENADDLPPEFLLGRAELAIEALNQTVYGEECDWRPIPVWLAAVDLYPERPNAQDRETATTTRGPVGPSLVAI
jgi:hypothetical protein